MNCEGKSMQRRRHGPVRHEKVASFDADGQGVSLGAVPQEMPLAPHQSTTEAIPAYPLRLLFEHLCVVANALERVVRHEVTTNTLDWALDALDHVIDRVAESLPPEDQ